MSTPTPAPAPMTAERLSDIRRMARACGPMGEDLRLCGDDDVKALLAHIDALTARVAELERERDGWRKAAQDNLDAALKHDAIAQAAEAKLETARRDALEEAIAVCTSLTFSDTTPTLRPGARMCAHKLRALQTKDTTP